MSGVFTLGQVGVRQDKGTWSTASDVWLLGSPVTVGESPFGYFAGGKCYNPGISASTVSRIDYGNDTATGLIKGPLGWGREYLNGLSNRSHG